MTPIETIEKRIAELEEYERMTHEPLCVFPNPFIARLNDLASHPSTLRLLRALLTVAKAVHAFTPRDCEPRGYEVLSVEGLMATKLTNALQALDEIAGEL